MGDRTASTDAFTSAMKRFVAETGPTTAKAEQTAYETGELHPLVDPKGYGVIRRSLPRFEQRGDGLWVLTVGTPIPNKTWLDTTGSMGNNVDIAVKALKDSYELNSRVLPGYDQQLAIGIFGDVGDRFVICRPQFEMHAEKIVEQLTLMVPARAGGDFPEDPHYGLFGSAYLTSAYINRIGLKGYNFTVSDAPARNRLDQRQLIRIYGEDVFDKAAENGYQINSRDLPSTAEIVQDLLKLNHGFFLQVDNHDETTRFWTALFGRERVVELPGVELLPQVQAAIIGLTEGILDLQNVENFLASSNVSKNQAKRILRSIANIPIGAQAAMPNFHKRPQKGEVFREKTDLWPIDPSELGETALENKEGAGIKWL